MLRAVGVARPEHQNERFTGRLEARQHNLGRHADEPVLLLDIGHLHAGHVVGAAPAVKATVRRGGLQARRLHRCRHVGREGYAFGVGACLIVNDDRGDAVPGRHVLDADRPVLPQDCGGKALGSRCGQQAGLPQIVAAEPLVEQAQHHIVLDGGERRAIRRREGLPNMDRVSEVARIAQQVSCGDRRGIGRGDRRIQRMAVGEIDALIAHGGQRRRGGRRHGV